MRPECHKLKMIVIKRKLKQWLDILHAYSSHISVKRIVSSKTTVRVNHSI